MASGTPGLAGRPRQHLVIAQPADHLPGRSVRVVAVAHPPVGVLHDEEHRYQQVVEEVGEQRPGRERSGHRQRRGNDRHQQEEGRPCQRKIARIAREIGRQPAAALEAGETAYQGLAAPAQGAREERAKRQIDQYLQLVDLRKSFLEYNLNNNPENKDRGILTTDRVHLNAKGNQLVADEMWKMIKEVK